MDSSVFEFKILDPVVKAMVGIAVLSFSTAIDIDIGTLRGRMLSPPLRHRY